MLRIDQIVETVEDLNFDGIRETTHVEAIRGSIPVSYRRWKNLLLSESGPCPESLLTFASANDESLRRIYEQATAEMGCSRVYRTDIDHVRLRSRIRSLFYPRKNVSVDIHQLSELAFASVVDDRKLVDIFGVPRNTFYPNEVRERQILESDTGKLSPEEENLVRQLEEQGFTEAAESIRSNKLGSEAPNTFQYIPYRFDSPFERDFYEIMRGYLKSKNTVSSFITTEIKASRILGLIASRSEVGHGVKSDGILPTSCLFNVSVTN